MHCLAEVAIKFFEKGISKSKLLQRFFNSGNINAPYGTKKINTLFSIRYTHVDDPIPSSHLGVGVL